MVDITKSRAALYYKRKQGNISDQSGPLSPKLPIESLKLHERLIEPKPIITGNIANKDESETNENENDTPQYVDTTASVLPSAIEKVSEKLAKVENENTEIKVGEFAKLVEAKEQKSDILFSNFRINKSLIEQNKALLKKVESISESVSNNCSKPSPMESILQKHGVLSGKTKTDGENKKDENTNNKQSVTEKNSENGTIKDLTENDSTNNRPIKSKITKLIEKRRAEELEKEEKQKEKETEKEKSEVKTVKSKFDGEKNLFLLKIIFFFRVNPYLI